MLLDQAEDEPFFDWLKRNSCGSQSSSSAIPWVTLFTFTVWIIWIQGNRKLYRLDQHNPGRTVPFIKERAGELWSFSPSFPCSHHDLSGSSRWTKPPVGFIKLNTDDSLINRSGKWILETYSEITLATGFWDFPGRLVFASCLAVELKVIHVGLSLAIDKGFR
ncbi:hypothetical protein SLE2022_056480 [Rubroshorea leprosula]